MKNTLLILMVLIYITKVNGQTIVINELMAKNNTAIQDKDGDFSDWIELFNTSDSTINLKDYRLSDDLTDLNKWVFPEVNLLPNSYLLIYASNKNSLDTVELHTNFKISTSGEELFLSNDLGVLIDETVAVELSGDESYSRVPDGSTTWLVTSASTPNSTNNPTNELVFSNEEGFYTDSFSLSITALLEDTIYYTLNGDIPTENSFVFMDSLLILNRDSEPNIVSEIPTTPNQNLLSYKAWESPLELVDKATVFRCASYRNGRRSSKVYTKTYFVDNQIADKYTLPVISLITQNDNLFNTDSGIFVPGVHYDSNNPEWSGNYFMKGENWERDVHIEYFDSNGTLGFSQEAGIRIHGGKTRQASQKSLRLYARKEYGEKYFNYNLLPSREVEKYKRFILRTTMGSWNDQTIIKDALAQNISAKLNIDYQEFSPVIVYINGEYWGVHTIRDRIDERYIEYTHDIDKDSVVFNESGNEDFEDLISFMEDNSLDNSTNYEYVRTQMDIKNYIDYTIAELFFKNYDWPANNLKAWKKIPNGKWRWVFYDLDAGLGDENYNMFLHATKNDSLVTWPNSPSSTAMFRNLLKNEQFQMEFINRYSEVLNEDFDTQITTFKLDSIKAIYSPEINDHIGRWNYPNSFNNWEEDIESKLRTFIENRPCVVKENIMSFFDLESFDLYCKVDSNVDTNFTNANKLILAPNPNNGNFFLLNTNSDIKDAEIAITNINGQVIYREENVSIMKNEKKYIDISNFPKQVYILKIKSSIYSDQKKIIITN